MRLDRRDQQVGMVGTPVVHLVVDDDLVLGLLELDHLAELVGLGRLAFADDLRRRLEQAEKLAFGSGTFPILWLAKRSSATPSCSAAPAPGPCIRARSPSPSVCFRRTRPRSPSRTRSRRRCFLRPRRNECQGLPW